MDQADAMQLVRMVEAQSVVGPEQQSRWLPKLIHDASVLGQPQ